VEAFRDNLRNAAFVSQLRTAALSERAFERAREQ
jgi:hypothetical protein